MKIGDKVVYVGACRKMSKTQLSGYFFKGKKLIKGAVYVVAKVVSFPHWPTVGLVLTCATSFDKGSGTELGFDARSFRLLDEMKANAKHAEEAKQS